MIYEYPYFSLFNTEIEEIDSLTINIDIFDTEIEEIDSLTINIDTFDTEIEEIDSLFNTNTNTKNRYLLLLD